MALKRPRIFLYSGLGFIGLCVLAYFVYPTVLGRLGAYLVVEDPLHPASAIIVLSGRSPVRTLEAARLYKDGWATRVILNQPWRRQEFYALQSLGIDSVEPHEYDREVLLRSGVPDEAIVVIEEEVENTIAELRAVLRVLSPSKDTTLIIVTSNYHTRRTSKIWNYLTGGEVKAIVRWTRRDTSFDTVKWWKNRTSVLYLANEYMGLINYWLGFPLGIAFL